MTEEITNNEDTIDSRDIIARIEELEEDDELEDWEKDELECLTALDQDGKGAYGDSWKYGIGLVRDSHFTEYAQKFASDTGAISDTQSWPANCIDWEQATNELQTDYTLLDFDGVEYWAR